MTPLERMYSYTQSSQIESQSGCIGHLRADMGSDGKSFFSSWTDHRGDLNLMNTLLSLEERFPVTVLLEGSVTRIQLEIPSKGITQLHCLLLSWRNMRKKLASGNLSREEYEEWKYSLI